MFQRILIAWDGSHSAELALDVAIDLARRYDAELTAVSVAHSPAHAETAEDRRESVDAARRYLEETFERVRDSSERVGVPLDLVVIPGDEPADDLLHYAHQGGFDLAVVGHHRTKTPGRFLLHGVAERLLATADLPLLVVSNDRRR